MAAVHRFNGKPCALVMVGQEPMLVGHISKMWVCGVWSLMLLGWIVCITLLFMFPSRILRFGRQLVFFIHNIQLSVVLLLWLTGGGEKTGGAQSIQSNPQSSLAQTLTPPHCVFSCPYRQLNNNM